MTQTSITDLDYHIVEPIIQIKELLDRVADNGSQVHSKFSVADTLQLDDDQFSMDFSDTLFSTFSQAAPNLDGSRVDYCKIYSTYDVLLSIRRLVLGIIGNNYYKGILFFVYIPILIIIWSYDPLVSVLESC